MNVAARDLELGLRCRCADADVYAGPAVRAAYAAEDQRIALRDRGIRAQRGRVRQVRRTHVRVRADDGVLTSCGVRISRVAAEEGVRAARTAGTLTRKNAAVRVGRENPGPVYVVLLDGVHDICVYRPADGPVAGDIEIARRLHIRRVLNVGAAEARDITRQEGPCRPTAGSVTAEEVGAVRRG